ncbi:hypothetical protein [Stenotrophomonas rhizophila]|uniref:hypothetical protein n=1 Tax=Stenotrophomonas rhizophila TaxID=216778 RepID=UPI001E3F393F|nr:hypothetical protein [Stenotrophomonas rhizophila]MCC7632519.1 hypothetical protein [Stenotrophomonas rhizophila]MCC7663371.1 hypothetical protein [Stenotrophomonas rhizophila]
MNETELATLISKTAALMEHYQRLCAQMEQQQKQASALLQTLARQIPAQLSESAQAAFRPLAIDASASLHGALKIPLQQHEQQMAQATRQLGEGAQALSAELRRYQLASRAVLWKSMATAVSAVLILGAGALWLGGHYRQEIQRNRIEADVLRVYNQADLVMCGEGKLCANVDTRARPTGANGQYRPVRPRP